VGIRAGDLPEDLAAWVLDEFPAADGPTVDETLDRAADAVTCLAGEGPAVAMNRFNARQD
jgi:peptidyl-tRNA hydrolase